MKRILFLAMALTACAKAPAPASSYVSKSTAAALPAFNDTSLESEASLLGTAAMALRAGVDLDAARAERCWKAEVSRPEVRETCLLLWAGKGSSSPLLESALIGGRSRILALALLQRPDLMARVSYSDLLAWIDILEKDALWVRAELAITWLGTQGHPGFAASEALLARIRPGESSGPRDIASALKAIRLLRAGAWQEAASAYCDTAALGESRLRCWKVIGSLGSMAANLQHFLPSFQDQDWILFTRSFPRQAEKLRPNLR